MGGDVCGDNRFEIIARAKQAILDGTNIDTSPDEMKVLDNFLFRCWQMDWLEKYDNDKPKESAWIPCSERLPEEDGRYLCYTNNDRMEIYGFANNLYKVDTYDFIDRRGKAGFYNYSSEWGYCEVDWITAWMPLPEPYKESEG